MRVCDALVIGWREDAVKRNDETTTTVVTETEVGTEQLTAFEERVLRMRAGRSLEPGEALGSKLDGVRAEVRDEVVARLLLMEAQLLADLAPDRMAEPVHSPAKQRIIDALRRRDGD